MNRWKSAGWAWVLLAGWLAGTSGVDAAAPVITHEPVKQAIKGQPLTLKAKVTSAVGVQAVTLYYTLSKDAAPFKIPMKPAGLDYYLGTIESAVLGGVSTLSYYIEAEDTAGAVRETPWQVLALRELKPGEAIPGGGAALAPPRGRQDDGGISLGLIAGGAAAVVGGAYLIAENDSGSDDDDPAPPSGDPAAGVYAGTANTCLTIGGLGTTCETHTITIAIDTAGRVLTSDLREGQTLNGQMSGSTFILTAPVDETDGTNQITGAIYYSGTVSGGQIAGSITGSQQGNPAGPGIYSGSFNATRP